MTYLEPNIGVYPSDQTGCGTYRLIWPGEAVRDIGRKTVMILNRPPAVAVDHGGVIHGVNVGNLDVVVFQRPASYQFAQMIPILHDHGKRIVIDMDDSLSKIHPRNRAYKIYDPRVNHKTNWMHAASACEMADIITVTTEKLAEEYGAHGRVEIIPNHIRASYLEIERKENPIPVVGWAGWTQTHIDDLSVTRGMINQALVETGAKFVAFGDEGIFSQLGIRMRQPHEHWSFTSVADYPKKLAGFDIGLVPLQKSEFNEGKSWLKGLEYASLGIVPIVTPIGDYHNLIDLGIAIPAATPKEWYDRTKELILDTEYRLEMSKRCREVASYYTFEGNWEKWWWAWGRAHQRML